MTKTKTNNNKGNNQAAKIQSLNSRVDRLMSLIPKGTFRNVGSTAGMALGGPVGATVGRAIGTGISAITGYGDYEVSMNSLNKMSTSVDTVPSFVRNDHSVRVTHREYVRDLAVPIEPDQFNNDAQPINPSNQFLFPWLANMARQYQQYRIHGMIVEYKTMSSDYAAAGPLGTVCIATNYNVLDKKYPTKVALENSEFAVSCKPSMSLIHAIECDPKVTGRDILYVRDPLSESTDPSDARLYDAGMLQIATAGLPGTGGTTLGEIWISYDIEFYKPVLASFAQPDPGPSPGPGPEPVPVTTSGYAVISQRDGSSSLTDGAMTYIQYQANPAALPDNDTARIYQSDGGAPTLLGDTGLNNNVVQVDQFGNIKLRKNGVYQVMWRLTGNTADGTTACVAAKTGQLTQPQAAIGVGSVGTLQTTWLTSNVTHVAAYPKTGIALATATCGIVVQDLPDDDYAIIACPTFLSYNGNHPTTTQCAIGVGWTQLQAADIVVP